MLLEVSIIQLSIIGYTDLYDAEIRMRANEIQEYQHTRLPESSEIRICHKYCTKPFKAREVLRDLFISVEQLREAFQIFIFNLKQVPR